MIFTFIFLFSNVTSRRILSPSLKPICSNCVHYIQYNSMVTPYMGKCRLFEKKYINMLNTTSITINTTYIPLKNKFDRYDTDYEYAVICRDDKYKCGIDGRYFLFNSKIYKWKNVKIKLFMIFSYFFFFIYFMSILHWTLPPPYF